MLVDAIFPGVAIKKSLFYLDKLTPLRLNGGQRSKLGRKPDFDLLFGWLDVFSFKGG